MSRSPDATVCRALVLDLRNVRFLDSEGLNMLIRLRHHLGDHDQRLFVVVADSSFLAKVLHMAQVDGVVSIHHHLGDALAAAQSD
ncbi:MAG TPA: STAS domain-containing protein [Acidimicrobiales bacterium]|nr:STAS domain-containing protein [Acidimicrobiales bacterium]